ncbi:MAG: ribulose-phosphate 3-epimerase [Candidatus Jettenia sp.]|uniref:Ribulose-phosphate 3-epimerase n=1 Tax=Candidatus Jettenia caeni TaxID=247490 RepID=I3IIT3_9BACT|nr:ribulose-phosphate 3-epimerase [Candidatus Jettenia sp. AMX1]MBC6928325.1 ribulose-phosphate 3-epimerase [Candidatus Jettenia sp.]NUN22772.1 ribulose-phosphate 3-epimerase [Candidatus Jettenia caeni]KAA0251046.1 MAG: ribulose-phosphate 3-epimerase [Candidatus Jettenia sp. AMX1]MCE7880692.1 ribulose-phosphate 3-epimerase [Candidatus Jettenia sp. AMX1]MCQ3926390.1 ribulose-phosphate 3-epimerase [Candidatus Jettenia sp.]
MQPKIKISASILAANAVRLEDEIKKVEKAGVDLIHIDVMDGHFVPNITMGTFIVEGVKRIAKVPLDIHLMIEYPERYIAAFAEVAGKNDFITFHIEATKKPKEVISLIKNAGLKAGISLNPNTSTDSVENFLDIVDMVLVMSVNPGFAGQKFISDVLPKVARLRSISPDEMDIEIDGGITTETISQAVQQGANVIVAASAIFKTDNPDNAIKTLRQIAEQTPRKKYILSKK